MTKSKKFIGELVENRIVIWNIEESREIFKMGFFGKPLGVPKPKAPDFNAPLILDLIEGYYLVNERKLSIIRRNKKVTKKTIQSICAKEYVDFDDKYLVYKKLREMNYVVSPGIKFGCDFGVYEQGPGIDHAPYLVQVVKPFEDISATEIILSGRLATTVRKQFILAIAKVKEDKVDFISFEWWRA